jgi:hypothetical protein
MGHADFLKGSAFVNIEGFNSQSVNQIRLSRERDIVQGTETISQQGN